MKPIIFQQRFGWLHAARGGRGVVLCAPTGVEALWVHRAWRALALGLAAAGLPTLRYDHHGAGDSAGEDTRPGRVRAWTDGLHAAIDTLRAETGVGEVALVGLRLGGLLAATVATTRDDVAALALLAPVTSGRAYARELTALARVSAETEPPPDLIEAGAVGAGAVEAGGFIHTRETLTDLRALSLAGLARRPAPRVLLLDRPGALAPSAAARRLRALGVAVREAPFTGYAALMRHGGHTPEDDFATLAAWLAEGAPPAAAVAVGHAAKDTATTLHLPEGWEQPVFVARAPDLFAIAGTPRAPDPRRPAVVFLNAGATHHVGSNRMWVTLARRLAAHGFTTLRLDAAGFGDSDSRPGRPDTLLYTRDACADVRAALDWLEARGHRRCALVGLCAGSTLALHVALADPRVVAQVLMNPGRFVLGNGDSLEAVTRSAVKRTSEYVRMLASPAHWLALLGGRRNALWTLRSLAVRSGHGLRILGHELAARLAGRRGDTAIGWFRRLSDRGVETLLVYGSEDFTLGELDTHLGRGGRKLARVPRARLEIIEGADHTLTRRDLRERVCGMIVAHLLAAGATIDETTVELHRAHPATDERPGMDRAGAR